MLTKVASRYKLRLRGLEFESKFDNLVEDMTQLGNSYASKIVVLIDEYDAPIIHSPIGSDLEKANLNVLRQFFTNLKRLNNYFLFTFVTGVSEFSLSEIFSGANHLSDITVHAFASTMFGLTQHEIMRTYSSQLKNIALKWSRDRDRTVMTEMVMEQMEKHYNGYRFSGEAFPTLPYYIDMKQEKQYHSNLHMLLQGFGFLEGRNMHMRSESTSSQGRSDIVLELGRVVYLTEMKYRSSGEKALEQIKEKQYHKPYLLRQETVILLGINFNEETRMIDDRDYEILEEHVKK
ncbi:hypothetical protein QAD02_016556 [Eretmocerus hayati]|uniref:Uncharacterized protein n=1 Tax=Eretmocerus hayati TaxID=131215 RepID=A0ACC2PAZ7_9HYME|nr:hypothetical protein QAD02_016556 [Eretmocerus hayati]